MTKAYQGKKVDHVIDHIIETLTSSKIEMYDIVESTRKEQQHILQRLEVLREEVLITLEKTEVLAKKLRMARKHLSEVSKVFSSRGEQVIKEAYEDANDLQVQHAISKEKEKTLIAQRNDLERRLKMLELTIEKADTVMTKFSIINNFLTNDVRELGEVMEVAQEKHELGVRILEIQEEERKRISREIHDGPAQMIANILLRSELLERIYRDKGPTEAIDETKALRSQIRSSLHEVRRIIYDLRPMALDDLGLIPALKKYLRTIEDFNSLPIKFIYSGSDKRLHNSVEVALFRIVQEAVQNAVKHAKATEMVVKIEVLEERAYVVIKDNGIGFKPNKVSDGSFGLQGIKERVDLLKGNYILQTEEGQGTSVIIKVPIN
ncbi:MAG: sensor histidine kinase, partial [Bacilli bacterium]